MKTDLDALNPKKMMKRFVSVFLGLFIINFFQGKSSWLDIHIIFLFTFIFMICFSLFEMIYLVLFVRYVKKINKKSLILLKIIHSFITWFLLWLISIILKSVGNISWYATILWFILEEMIYHILTLTKEDSTCQKNQYQ